MRPGSQAAAEGAADERGDDAHLAVRNAEHRGEFPLGAADPLGLVPDDEAVAVPACDGRVRFHRVVVVARGIVGDVQFDRGTSERGVGVAARVGGGFAGRGRVQVGGRLVCVIPHFDQPGGVLRGLEGVGDHDRDGLAEKPDPVVLEDAEPVAFGIVRVRAVAVGEPGRVEVADHRPDAGVGERGAVVDRRDASHPDAAVNHDGVQRAVDFVFGGVGGVPGHLEPTVHPGNRGSDGSLGLRSHWPPPTTRS